jgi:hypothetical protein
MITRAGNLKKTHCFSDIRIKRLWRKIMKRLEMSGFRGKKGINGCFPGEIGHFFRKIPPCEGS